MVSKKWTVVESPDSHVSCSNPGTTTLLVKEGEETVATVVLDRYDPSIRVKEVAQLIGAAWELLQASELALEYFKCETQASCCGEDLSLLREEVIKLLTSVISQTPKSYRQFKGTS